VLLEVEGQLAPGELATRLRYWLSATQEAGDNARLVSGLFALHRPTLLRSPAVIGAVTEFLQALSLEDLTPLLPVLRRGLGDLTAAERAYLGETLAVVLGIAPTQTGPALALSTTDRAWLAETDAAVAAVLRTWEERYGL
jgi:hypothetical protein